MKGYWIFLLYALHLAESYEVCHYYGVHRTCEDGYTCCDNNSNCCSRYSMMPDPDIDFYFLYKVFVGFTICMAIYVFTTRKQCRTRLTLMDNVV